MLSVDWMEQQPAYEALMLLISCGCITNCATYFFLYVTRFYHIAADALIFANARIEESLYQNAIDNMAMRKKIKT